MREGRDAADRVAREPPNGVGVRKTRFDPDEGGYLLLVDLPVPTDDYNYGRVPRPEGDALGDLSDRATEGFGGKLARAGRLVEGDDPRQYPLLP